MVALILVRHGVTPSTGERAGGRTSASLTEEGRGQAEAVAERLAGEKLAAIYSSPIVRARETAAPIAQRHGLDIALVDGVQELDHGTWTDKPLKQMANTKLFEWVVRTPSRVALPDGEAFVTAQTRAVLAVEEIVAAHPQRATVVVVSHADIIKLIVAHYAGMPLDAFQRLVVSPASCSRLVLPKRGEPRVLSFNDACHLRAA